MTAPVDFAGAGSLTATGSPVITNGTASLGGSGSLSAQGSGSLLARASSSYDSAGISSNIVNLPVPAAVQNTDFGIILVTWVPGTGVPSVSATGWTALLDNSGSTSSPFVILTRAYQTADGSNVEIDFSQSLLPTVVASWYPSVARVDTLGLVSARNGNSSATLTASSVTVGSSVGGMVLGLFVERSTQVGTLATVSNGGPKVFREGSGASTASAMIADSYVDHAGTFPDMVATYNTPSGNGAAVMLSLLPVGASIIGFPRFSGSGSLQTVGAVLAGNPFFSASGQFSAVGAVRGRVNFAAGGTLSGSQVFHGSVAFGGAGLVNFIPTGRPALAGGGQLSVVGIPIKFGTVAFAGGGAVAFTGAPRPIVRLGLGAGGALDSQGSNPHLSTVVSTGGGGAFTASGKPSYSIGIAFTATGKLVVKSPLMAANGNLVLGQDGVFSARGVAMKVGGSVNLFTDTGLILYTLADFTPHGYANFGTQAVLRISGGLAQPAPSLITHQPYYVRQTQHWAVEQERQRHTQAIYQIGEPVLFVLMWKVEDYEAGLITKCPRCAERSDSIDARVAAVYKQPQTAKCPYCFGTTFYGGVRAKIRRPAIITDADEDERKSSRGVTHSEQTMVQTTDDFRARTGDYVFRLDGSRWQLGHPERVMLRTGFQHPSQAADSIGYARIPASREDKSSVAFEIPPNKTELRQFLQSPDHYPNV